jgi:hypothetical protein
MDDKRDVASVSDAPGPGGWLTSVAVAGREVEARMGDPERLDALTGWIAGVADLHKCGMVTGASRLGDQLAGVVAGASEGRLKLWAENGATGTLLVIDGVLASGTQVSRRAEQARRHGAHRVVGAVLVADPAGLDVCRRGMGDEVAAMSLLDAPVHDRSELLT